MRTRRSRAAAAIVVAVTAFGCAACSSGAKTGSSTVSPPPSPPPTGGCSALKNLMQVELVVIDDLQAGKVTEPSAEEAISGVTAKLAQADEQAGRTSILGIALEQLVSANGTFSQALNQNVPVANLDSLIGTINQDVTNVENNCHAP